MRDLIKIAFYTVTTAVFIIAGISLINIALNSSSADWIVTAAWVLGLLFAAIGASLVLFGFLYVYVMLLTYY